MKTHTITVPAQKREYPIYIGKNILGNIKKYISVSEYSKVIVITDTALEKILLPDLNLHKNVEVATIEPGEQSKNADSVLTLWKQLLELKADRKTLVLNLGGGVITDIGGFAASTFMRGLDFVHIPTTLLSMVDASVGGKTGINFEDTKNIIGTFQQPKAVLIDLDTLKTLPTRELNAGFAEIIKHGLIMDAAYFRDVSKKRPVEYTPEEMIAIIERSCELKAQIVQSDETETGPRKLLNFGHTLGHALETLSHEVKMPLLHGEAIAIGIVGEAYLSNLLGWIEAEELALIEEALERAGLPTRITTIENEKIQKKMLQDKKNEQGTIKWTLLKAIGQAEFNCEVPEALVEKMLFYISQKHL